MDLPPWGAQWRARCGESSAGDSAVVARVTSAVLSRRELGRYHRAIAIDSDCVSSAGTAWLSRTRTTKLRVPFFVGVPPITPVEPLRLRPGGRLPDARDQL